MQLLLPALLLRHAAQHVVSIPAARLAAGSWRRRHRRLHRRLAVSRCRRLLGLQRAVAWVQAPPALAVQGQHNVVEGHERGAVAAPRRPGSATRVSGAQ